MRPGRRIVAAAALAAASALTLVPGFPGGRSAVAQEDSAGLRTDVRISEVTAAAGAIAGDRVKVINLTGRSVRVTSLLRDVGTDASGEPISVARGTGARSAADWLRVDPSTFTLDAGASRDVALRVVVPAGTRPGGYYGSVQFDAAGVTASRASSHVVLVRVPGEGEPATASVVRFDLPTLSVGGPVDIRIEVANRGSVHSVVRGRIVLEDQFGNNVGRLVIPNAIVLPGRQRLLTVRWTTPPPLARVSARVSFQPDGEASTASASGFAVAWWVVAAAGLAFVLPAYGFAARGRRRRRRAAEEAEARRRPAPPVGPLAPAPEGAWPESKPGDERRRRREARAERKAERKAARRADKAASRAAEGREEAAAAAEPAPKTPPVPSPPRPDVPAPATGPEAFAPTEPADRPRTRPVPVSGPRPTETPRPETARPQAARPEPARPQPVSPPVAEREEPERTKPFKGDTLEEPWAPAEEPDAFEDWLQAIRAETDVPPARPRADVRSRPPAEASEEDRPTPSSATEPEDEEPDGTEEPAVREDFTAREEPAAIDEPTTREEAIADEEAFADEEAEEDEAFDEPAWPDTPPRRAVPEGLDRSETTGAPDAAEPGEDPVPRYEPEEYVWEQRRPAAPPPAASRPVPVAPGPARAPTSPPEAVHAGPASTEPAQEETSPPRRAVPVAREEPADPVWPDLPDPSSLPGWPEPSAEALTGGAAMRRVKVALDMLAGPTGETGAILDAALELLRSVRSEPAVVEAVEAAFAKNRARRKLGPLSLALAVVSSPQAPAALLDSYATAPKIVADRIQTTLSAYDTAELRSHPELLEALPPARRLSLGV